MVSRPRLNTGAIYMGCEGCYMSAGGQVSALIGIREEAIRYARENGVSVAIWKEGYDYFFSSVATAIENGKPYFEVVTATYGTS